MTATMPVKEKVSGVWYITTIISYTDGKSVKRFYNLKGELVDAQPIKNFSIHK